MLFSYGLLQRATRLAGIGTSLVLAATLLSPTLTAQVSDRSSQEALRARPAADLPAPPAAQWIQDRLPQGDSISDADLARRIARLYSVQAQLLNAEVEGDAASYTSLLTGAMRDLRQLSIRPGVAEQTRFRELYRTILNEYETFRGPQPELALDQGEIYDLRDAMYASLDLVRDPLLEDVNLPSNMMATFPMTLNRAVENQIRFYLRNNRHVATVRQRAETYFPMIEQILAEEGVPDELKYLAVIESALNPTARSWAGAAGMWQFIPSTGRHSGLVVTGDVDERLDPEKSTRAAARHLLELYAMFGDWQLAIAGYNCNPAVIRREVARAEQRLGRTATFWDIWDNIPRETRGYIPSYIAVSLLFSNPQAFNLGPATSGPRYEFDVVPVRGGTSLAVMAERAGTDLRTLQALNPALRQNRVPEWADGFEVRVPAGHYMRYQRELVAMVRRTQDAAPRTVAYHGQNRRVIAFAEPHTPGQAPAASRPMVPVQQVADGMRSGRSIAPEAPAAASTRAAAPASQRINYRVRRGDTLSRIARAHGVSIAQLRQWNNIRGSHIRIGQRLTIHRPASRRS